jgi:hypothetical protein
MKRLFAWIFGWPLVWTQDHDGEVRLRKARKSVFDGTYTVRGVWLTVGFLSPNGDILHGCYLSKWKPANKKAEELFK